MIQQISSPGAVFLFKKAVHQYILLRFNFVYTFARAGYGSESEVDDEAAMVSSAPRLISFLWYSGEGSVVVKKGKETGEEVGQEDEDNADATDESEDEMEVYDFRCIRQCEGYIYEVETGA